MKQLFQLISKKITSWYFFQELKEISLFIGVLLTIWGVYTFGIALIEIIWTQKALTYLAFFFASLILSQTIKIFYRIQVIKYYEKDTKIELFKNLHSIK